MSSLYQQPQAQQDLFFAQQALNNSSRRGSGLGGGGNHVAFATGGTDLRTLDDVYKLLGGGGGGGGMNPGTASFHDQTQPQAGYGGLYNIPAFANLQSQGPPPQNNNNFLMQQHLASLNQGYGVPGVNNNATPQDSYAQNLLLESLNQQVRLAQQQQNFMDQRQLLQLAQQHGGLLHPHAAATQGPRSPAMMPEKAEPPVPKTALPLRALSAYNFYFRDERERILNGGEPEYSSEKKRALLSGHWYRDRTVKRRHRKTHGKVSFTTLSKLISQRWRELSAEHKEFYRQIAQEDLERYQKELGTLNGNVTTGNAGTANGEKNFTAAAGAPSAENSDEEDM